MIFKKQHNATILAFILRNAPSLQSKLVHEIAKSTGEDDFYITLVLLNEETLVWLSSENDPSYILNFPLNEFPEKERIGFIRLVCFRLAKKYPKAVEQIVEIAEDRYELTPIQKKEILYRTMPSGDVDQFLPLIEEVKGKKRIELLKSLFPEMEDEAQVDKLLSFIQGESKYELLETLIIFLEIAGPVAYRAILNVLHSSLTTKTLKKPDKKRRRVDISHSLSDSQERSIFHQLMTQLTKHARWDDAIKTLRKMRAGTQTLWCNNLIFELLDMGLVQDAESLLDLLKNTEYYEEAFEKIEAEKNFQKKDKKALALKPNRESMIALMNIAQDEFGYGRLKSAYDTLRMIRSVESRVEASLYFLKELLLHYRNANITNRISIIKS